MPDSAPIRVVKKVSGHGGHHGGAWKVAFADFMTALMAFFLVMWIMGLSESTRKAISGYFNDPIGFTAGYESGRTPFATTEFKDQSGKDASGAQMAKAIGGNAMRSEKQKMRDIEKQIENKLHEVKGMDDLAKQVEISVTNEGLRIELVDRTDVAFFELGSATLTPKAKQLLMIIASKLKPVANRIVYEGHTDSRQYAGAKYTNWELSFDRANAARHVLEEQGLADRTDDVRAFADRMLRVPRDPLNPSNRRVSILVLFSKKATDEQTTSGQDNFFKDSKLRPEFE